jgi:ATP-dependent RNA helicase DeaD
LSAFDDLKLSEPLARAVHELGFTTPTPIQAQALPVLLAGPTDFIGLAATGTGKTAAFGIPLLEKIDLAKRQVQAVVLCPTRELAVQVCGQIRLMGKHMGVRTLQIYGGVGYDDQLEGLKRGVQIVVGTPGRIIDHLERKTLDLSGAKIVVLDEADEMISMGFKDELEAILRATPRETGEKWLFSATMSPEVRRVADTYLRKPKTAQVNRTEMLSSTVEQVYYIAREHDKPEILCKLLDLADDFYGLVFCQTKALVMDLTQYLVGRGYKADCLHGDKSQAERERTMKAFRDKKTSLLVCTDVAARGLDVKELTHVINYSIPRELELYVHRIGRTARSGKAGIAVSLVTPATRSLVNRVEHLTKTRLREAKVPGRREVAAKKIGRILARFEQQQNFQRAADLLGPDWERVAGGMTLAEVIGRFLTMLVPDVFEEREKEKPLHQPHVPRQDGERRPRKRR